MKKKTHINSFIGYIEGYYGKLLSWESRELIIKSLHKNSQKEDKMLEESFYRQMF